MRDSPTPPAMPHLPPFEISGFDSIVASITALVTAVSTTLLAITPDPTDELKLLLVPLVGSLLVAAGTILLYPERETRGVVVGRASIALVFSTLTPQVGSILFPSTAAIMERPIILLFSGAVLFMPFYVVIKPLFEGMYRRRRAVAEAVLDKSQQQLLGSMTTIVETAVDGKFQDAVNDPRAKQAARHVIATAVEAAQELKRTAEEVKEAAVVAGTKTERLQS